MCVMPAVDLICHNPWRYHREMLAIGESSISLDMRYAYGGKDQVKLFSDLLSTAPSRRIFVMDGDTVAEYGPQATCATDQPVAVYPRFSFYTQRLDDLVYLLDEPWSDRADLHSADIPRERRPVPSQPHRIFVAGIPSRTSPAFGTFSQVLQWARETYPEVQLYGHSDASVVSGMLLGCHGVTFNPLAGLMNGMLTTQYGSSFRIDDLDAVTAHEADLAELGFDVEEIHRPRGTFLGQHVRYAVAAARFSTYYWHHQGSPGPANPSGIRPDRQGGTLDEYITGVVRKKLLAERAAPPIR